MTKKDFFKLPRFILQGSPISFLQGRFQLLVQVWDNDVGQDDKVTDIYIQNVLGISQFWTNSREFSSNTGVSITLRFRVQCDPNYYGNNCATYCIPHDSSSGHYTCGSNGQKICRSGWSDSSTNCLTRMFGLILVGHTFVTFNI